MNLIKKIFSVSLTFLIYFSVIYFFSFTTADPDLWGHIKFGEDLWASKSIPTVDIYSFTADGKEWINHEWLAELLMYGLFDTFGSAGLLISKLVLGLSIIFILTRISSYRKRDPLIYVIISIASISIMSPGFMTRPQIITFLFTGIFLFVFHLYLERKKDLLWLLPLIMLVWVNSHGGFVIGAGIFPIVVLCEAISIKLKGTGFNNLRRIIFWMILTEAAVFINPYGYRLLIFLYETLSVPRSISEWNPVTLFDLSYIRLKILSLLFLISLLIDRHNHRYWEIFIIAITMVNAFFHERHTPIFAIAAAPYLIEKLSILVAKIRLDKRIYSMTSYSIISIAVTIIIGYQISNAAGKYIKSGFNILVDPAVYPVLAAGFLKENKIKGNISLPFEWGEYAIWKLFPDCRVSIDGRFRTVYPNEILEDHFNSLNNQEKWMALLDKYPANIILARRGPLSERLIRDPGDWMYVYSDSLSIIFIKNDVFNKEIIKKFRERRLIYPKTNLSIYFP